MMVDQIMLSTIFQRTKRMPLKRISLTKKAIVSALDVNGNGSVDLGDAVTASKKVASSAFGLGAVAFSAAKTALRSTLDVNGDGVIDHHDAVVAVKLAGATAVGVGATALASAAAGSAIVATGAAAVASSVTAIAGAAAGAFVAATLGTTTAVISVAAIGPAGLFLGTATVTSAVSAQLLALSMGTGALMAQVANGVVAGFPIIQSMALANAVAAQEVILIAGVPMGVSAAIVAGLIAIVIVGGYAYYLLTADQVGSTESLPTGSVLA